MTRPSTSLLSRFVDAARRHVSRILLDNAAMRECLLQQICQRHFAAAAETLLATDGRQVVEKAWGTLSGELWNLVGDVTGASWSFGQEGEDVLLRRLLDSSSPGFFVDVGAHHPIRFSNTYALYRAGWRGINVDATPGSMALFRQLRPEDINIECAVSDNAEPLRFHLFAEGALNTADAALARRYKELGWAMTGAVDVVPRSLASLLEEHLPSGRAIDLMSIDVENAEMGVLRSNDWDRFRPVVLVIEALDTALADLEGHPTIAFLRERGYRPASKLINSVILRLEG